MLLKFNRLYSLGELKINNKKFVYLGKIINDYELKIFIINSCVIN